MKHQIHVQQWAGAGNSRTGHAVCCACASNIGAWCSQNHYSTIAYILPKVKTCYQSGRPIVSFYSAPFRPATGSSLRTARHVVRRLHSLSCLSHPNIKESSGRKKRQFILERCDVCLGDKLIKAIEWLYTPSTKDSPITGKMTIPNIRGFPRPFMEGLQGGAPTSYK